MLDDDLLLVINGWREPLTFTLPDVGSPRAWGWELDTFSGTFGRPAEGAARRARPITVGPRSLVLLRAPRAAS